MKAEQFVQNVLSCMGAPYDSPGTTNLSAIQGGAGVDCSGLLVAAGAKVSHGSNTMWRKEMTEKGRISDGKPTDPYPAGNDKKSSQLQVGMAVFKHKAKDTSKYPDGQGDYCHVGVVTSVNPLNITHASTEADCVTIDTKIGKWCAWGRPKGIDFATGESEADFEVVEVGGDTMYQAQVTTNVNVRQGRGTDKKKIGLLKTGTIVNVYAEEKGWSRINYNDELAGWCVSNCLSPIKGTIKDVESPSLPIEEPKTDYVLMKDFIALQARVKALQAGVDMGE